MNRFWKNARRALLLSLLLTVLFSISAFAGTQGTAVGTVTASKLRMRTDSSTSASIVTNLAKDTVVSVLGEKNGWYNVAYGGKTGYVSGDYLTVRASASDLSTYGRVTGSKVNVRSDAGTEFSKVMSVYEGGYVKVSAFKNGWYQISCAGKTGWIRSDYLDLYESKPSASSAGSVSNIPAGTATSNGKTYTISATVADLVSYAKSFLGVPYRYGGTSANGFDCSGFTMHVFKHFGISLPHSATSQLGYGLELTRADLQAGDLVFFRDTSISTKAASHVGIYLGGGDFVHASSSSGRCVKISNLSESYYNRVFTVGRRLIAE